MVNATETYRWHMIGCAAREVIPARPMAASVSQPGADNAVSAGEVPTPTEYLSGRAAAGRQAGS